MVVTDDNMDQITNRSRVCEWQAAGDLGISWCCGLHMRCPLNVPVLMQRRSGTKIGLRVVS